MNIFKLNNNYKYVYFDDIKIYSIEQIDYWYIPSTLHEYLYKNKLSIIAPMKCNRKFNLYIKSPYDNFNIYE